MNMQRSLKRMQRVEKRVSISSIRPIHINFTFLPTTISLFFHSSAVTFFCYLLQNEPTRGQSDKIVESVADAHVF